MQQSIVANIIRRRNESNNKISERRGRKPKLAPRCIRSLLNYDEENRFKPLRVITLKFNEFREGPVSKSTARRVLKQQVIRNYVAVCKPFLTRNYEKIRLNWAKYHKSWGENNWDTVLFSDETPVTVRPKIQRKRVWRLKGQRYNASNLCPSFKSGYIGISVWAAFSMRGRTHPVLIGGTLK